MSFLIILIRDVNNIEDLMLDIGEQQDIAREISEAISGPVGDAYDEVCVTLLHFLNIPFFFWNVVAYEYTISILPDYGLCSLCLL